MNDTTSISTSVGDLLRHAGAAGAAERGQVHIISVAAIREAVGERWNRHEPLVEDFVIRSFRRNARDDDFIVRVNEGDFILIQPSRKPMAALSRASLLMRETLSYFLGAVKTEHIHISVVDRLAAEGVKATRVDEGELARASEQRAVDLTKSEDGSPPWERFGVARPPPIAVHMPLSFNCMSHSSSRNDVLANLRALNAADWKSRLLIEITDVPIGLLYNRLVELIAQIKPFCRGVLVRAPHGSTDVLRWERCGAVGVIANVAEGVPERDQFGRISRFAEDAAKAGFVASLYGVRTRSLALAAWGAGIRLLSGDYVAEKYGGRLVAQRFFPQDLYRTRQSLDHELH